MRVGGGSRQCGVALPAPLYATKCNDSASCAPYLCRCQRNWRQLGMHLLCVSAIASNRCGGIFHRCAKLTSRTQTVAPCTAEDTAAARDSCLALLAAGLQAGFQPLRFLPCHDIAPRIWLFISIALMHRTLLSMAQAAATSAFLPAALVCFASQTALLCLISAGSRNLVRSASLAQQHTAPPFEFL